MRLRSLFKGPDAVEVPTTSRVGSDNGPRAAVVGNQEGASVAVAGALAPSAVRPGFGSTDASEGPAPSAPVDRGVLLTRRGGVDSPTPMGSGADASSGPAPHQPRERDVLSLCGTKRVWTFDRTCGCGECDRWLGP